MTRASASAAARVARLPDWRPLHAATQAWLTANGHSTREYFVRDVDESFGVSHVSPRVRTYVVKLRYRAGTQYVVVAMPAGLRVDMTATRKALFAESGWIATLGEVARFAGSSPFSVPAFADVCPLPIVLDSRVAVAPEIFVPSGRPSHAVRVAPSVLAGTRGLYVLQVETRRVRVLPPRGITLGPSSNDMRVGARLDTVAGALSMPAPGLERALAMREGGSRHYPVDVALH